VDGDRGSPKVEKGATRGIASQAGFSSPESANVEGLESSRGSTDECFCSVFIGTIKISGSRLQ